MLKAYSYSALDSFKSCPRKFKFQYIDKTKVPRKVNAEALMGNIVHRALRRLYTLGADGVVCPLHEIITYYREQFAKIDKSTIEVASEYHDVGDYLKVGEELLKKHYEQYQPFNQGTLIGTEMNAWFTLPGTPFRFRAIIDRLWKRDDGVIEICDYKTGKTLLSANDRPFVYQMGIYQLAVQEKYPHFEKIEQVQYYLRHGEEIRKAVDGDELEMLTEELRAAVLETIDAARSDSFPTKEGGYCHYCAFVDICPAKRHQKLLDDADEQVDDKGEIALQVSKLADQYIEADDRYKAAKNEKDAIKTELVRLAGELDLSKIVGNEGEVSVRISNESKFVTKSEDQAAFAELTHLARELKMDDYFALDARSFYKDIYRNRRLSDDELAKLEPFIRLSQSSRVTAKRYTSDDDDSDDQ